MALRIIAMVTCEPAVIGLTLERTLVDCSTVATFSTVSPVTLTAVFSRSSNNFGSVFIKHAEQTRQPLE